MTEETQPATLVENMLLLRREDFDDLLDRAAERGAERALAHLGLENGHAAKDIRELRDLLQAWRDARRTAWQTAVKVVTTGILAAAGRCRHQVEADGRRAMKTRICLLDNWRCVLRRAWSIRFSLLAAAFTAAEVVVPIFGDVLPRGLFVLLAFAASIGATVARIVAQPEMHR